MWRSLNGGEEDNLNKLQKWQLSISLMIRLNVFMQLCNKILLKIFPSHFTKQLSSFSYAFCTELCQHRHHGCFFELYNADGQYHRFLPNYLKYSSFLNPCMVLLQATDTHFHSVRISNIDPEFYVPRCHRRWLLLKDEVILPCIMNEFVLNFFSSFFRCFYQVSCVISNHHCLRSFQADVCSQIALYFGR